MNRTELVAAMAEKTQLSKKDAEAALKAFVDVVSEEMKKGEKVQLVGFGTFEVSERGCKRRKKSSDRRDNDNRSFQNSEVQSWKSFKGFSERIIENET